MSQPRPPRYSLAAAGTLLDMDSYDADGGEARGPSAAQHTAFPPASRVVVTPPAIAAALQQAQGSRAPAPPQISPAAVQALRAQVGVLHLRDPPC